MSYSFQPIQEHPEVMRNFFGALPMTQVEPEIPFPVIDINPRTMINRVPTPRPRCLFGIKYSELLRHLSGRALISTQSDKQRVERRNITPQNFRCITLRIQRDKQHLNPISIRPQKFQRLGEVGQGGRANIRTMRIPEKQRNQFPFEIRQVPNATSMILQGKIRAQLGPGNFSPDICRLWILLTSRASRKKQHHHE